MSKFIIFAHARSGSTSLAKVLGESPDVKMAIEPFHPNYSVWNPKERNYSKFVKNKRTFDKALEEIFTKYTAMKVLDYQLPKEVYFILLKNRDLKIIFLRRKNLVDAAISNAVSEQTAEWHKSKNDSIYNNLKPLNIEKLEKWIKYVGKLSKQYSNFLKENRRGDFLTLNYEDLYSESFEENKRTLKRISNFLNIDLPPDKAIKKYMMPTKAKINHKNIYKKVPNYEEIANVLGRGKN